MGGGTKYDQSYGAERGGNAELARSKEDSRARSGTKNDRPHALSVTKKRRDTSLLKRDEQSAQPGQAPP